jgi:hypothetical protein
VLTRYSKGPSGFGKDTVIHSSNLEAIMSTQLNKAVAKKVPVIGTFMRGYPSVVG